ncbi:MAG: hypothetical protein ACO3F2_10985 [Roseiflexaceae bacterium]
MRHAFVLILLLMVGIVVVYQDWRGPKSVQEGLARENVVYGAAPRLTRTLPPRTVTKRPPTKTRTVTRRPPTKTRTVTRRPPTKTRTPYPTFCQRNWGKNWHFCGYQAPSAYVEGYGRNLAFRANTPIRILLDGGYIEFRISNGRRSWTFLSSSKMQTVRLPKGTYEMCFNDATGMYDCGGGWASYCFDGGMSCLFSPSGLGYGSSGEEIIVR